MNAKNQKKSLLVVRKSSAPVFESHNRRVTTKMGQVEKILPRDACRILDTCGSCALLNLNYKSQLLQKTNKLKETLKGSGPLFSHTAVQHFVESQEKLGYRQSVKLVVSEHFVQGKSWIDIGFYREALNKIVDIGNCPIQNSVLNDVMFTLRSALKTFQIPIYSPKRKTGLLSGLILRSSHATKQTFVILLVRQLKTALFRELACFLIEKYSYIQGVFLQLENFETAKHAENVLVAGTNIMEEKFDNLKFKLSGDMELPIHPSMTSKIYARVVELCDLTGLQTLLHVHSGIGALSCLLAKKARFVYALDEKESYAKNLEANLKLHGIKNVHVEIGKINEKLSQLPLASCSAVVVSVPRNGLKDEVIEKLCTYSPQQILFVGSFNEHMVDNLKCFAKNKYRTLFVEPFDTHPGTAYFEVLCYLQPIMIS